MFRILAILVTLGVVAVLAAPAALRLAGGTGGIARLMQAGDDQAADGDWVAARLRYEQVLSNDPENLDARLGLARALRDGGLFELSATHLLYIIGKDPEMPAPRIEFAEMLFMAGELSESRMHLDRAGVTEGALLPRAQALTAAHAAAEGDDAQALAQARAALAADPGLSHAYATQAAVALRAEDFDTALAALDAARTAQAETLSHGLMRLGILERQGRTDAIGSELRVLSETYPDVPELRLALARWIAGRHPDRTEDAREILISLVRDSADDAAALSSLTSDAVALLGNAAAFDVFNTAGADPALSGQLEQQIAVLEGAAGDTAAARARLSREIENARTPEARNSARILLARLMDPVTEGAARLALAAAVLEDDPQNPSAHLLLADAETRRGAPEAAISHLRTVLSVRPDDAGTLMALARAHALAGSLELALDRLSKAVQVSNHAPDLALTHAGLIEGRQGAAPAAELIDIALEQHPQDLDLLTRRAALALRAGDVATARGLRSRLADLPGGADTVPELDLAIAAQSGTLQTDMDALARDDSPEGQLLLARGALRAGRAAQAAEILDARLAAAPGTVDALLLRADAALALQDTDAAVANLDEAMRLAPERPAIAASLARLLLALDRPEAADEAIAGGLAHVPQDYELAVLQAYRLDRTGQTDAARDAFDALSRRAPGDPRVAFRLARLLTRPGTSAAEVDRALQLTAPHDLSDDPERQAIRGWVLHRAGSSTAALDLLRDAAPRRVEDPQTQAWLGLAERGAGNPEAALAAVSRALDLAAGGAAFDDDEVRRATRRAHDEMREASHSARSN
ncbi:tetratricopeptide repeat protein [Salipiger sp. IMCC34102]|uniref:tetratricopeptide repeat protein n=1 Tax=Salipiger sp. IMCC34102 TaxID=2510647 RepID=UPI00101D3ED5|nr:tetratricopeptide repeat protein [Salipiger sp. IMCC34102]RYH01247.1 tetratricopeptide repeat protein [Salipiger sp. IMCC34102]